MAAISATVIVALGALASAIALTPAVVIALANNVDNLGARLA